MSVHIDYKIWFLISFYSYKFFIILFVGLAPKSTNLYYEDQFASVPIYVIPGFWNNVCSQIDFGEALWTLFLNDKKFTTSINITLGRH